ncbi:MAG: heparinase II/III-family protein [Propionibacteriaceae bacterium]|nr:heparinase II/III-family protein [Propionibacteriaceae bacterium]
MGPLAQRWPGLTRDDLAAHLAPGLPLPPGDPVRWARSDPAASIRAQALAERALPWPAAPAHAWARFRQDGDRGEYETSQFARVHRLSRAVVAALADPSPRALDAVLDGVVLLCEQSSWCWPAHDDAWDVRREVLPDVTRPFLDLGAGETLSQLAWIDAVLGRALDRRFPGVRARLRIEADRRVFVPFVTRRDWGWLTGQPNNWNPWIHGNVLTGALQLIEDPARRADVVLSCVRGLDRYVAALPEDGACDEGSAYWWQGPCRLIEAAMLLRDATDGWLDALQLPLLRAAVAFPLRMSLGAGWFVNYADASARPSSEQPWHVLYRAACAVGDADAAAFAVASAAYRDVQADDGLGRCVSELADGAWAGRSHTVAAVLPRQTWYPSVQVFVAREHEGHPDGLAVSAKGGHNGENHNHADIGTVIVALDGVPVIVDAGRPTYTAATFGPGRYELWPLRSAWHNVPLLDGAEQGVGPQFAARGATAALGADAATFAADLGGAYPSGGSLRREVILDRTRAQVSVSDAWDAGRTAEERFLLAGTLVVAEPGRALVRTLAGAECALCWAPPVPPQVVRTQMDDPLLQSVWGEHLTQLRLAPSGSNFLLIVARNDHNGSSAPAAAACAGSGGTTGEGSAHDR